MFSKGGKRKPRALRHLALQELGLVIQEGEHSSVDDARAGMLVHAEYKRGLAGACGSALFVYIMKVSLARLRRLRSIPGRPISRKLACSFCAGLLCVLHLRPVYGCAAVSAALTSPPAALFGCCCTCCLQPCTCTRSMLPRGSVH
jgi:hypothetical protein